MYEKLILAIVMQGIASYLFYKIGYEARERKMQKYPLTYYHNGRPILRVEKTSDGVLVGVYDKKRVTLA